ncbi:MAG: O-acetyl-ADP-ribose deacetylase [Clostridia bacterium]|nr:O-acetyl-ADP-ribose deacetylase [Clostridia bacterium]
MPLQIVRQDITKINVDAIVNAANSSLMGGGGVDGCIHRAAGPKLLDECKTLGGCNTGDAKITGAYNLPCKYVIHTVGPVYKDGQQGEENLLRSCYITSLQLAKKHNCESVAFPLISSGIFGYPKADALRVAVDTISSYLLENDMCIYIVIFDKNSYEISGKLFADIEEFIDDNYVNEHFLLYPENRIRKEMQYSEQKSMSISMGVDDNGEDFERILSLEEVIEHIDESFTEMLLRKIDEKGMKDSECYKKANIDRKLFSKIRSDIHYKPSKSTVIAFAIALELSLEETKDMLMKAGFALSHSSKFDLIIEFFIRKGNYNVFEINEALFAFDQVLLGV